ncbi:MAG TPA: hypothetical protein VJ853_01375 [Thermoanaerobaculia bacterium]|nr:hypothetical protein [Thermoanaerobaculia bacterium]
MLAYLARFDVHERRPDVTRTVGYAPSADWTADIVADAALNDAYSPVDLSNVTPRARQSWIEAMTHLGDELHATRDLLLDAIARRPGWPFHESLLGQVVFAADSRDANPELTRRSAMWSEPLLDAAESAPAATSVWQSLAAAYVATWPELNETHLQTTPRVFRNAFSDPEFVHLMFPSAASVMGSQRALSYIPNSPQPLRVAFDFFASRNDIPAAAQLRQSWERAEREQRARDLAQIEQHAGRGDVEETRALIRQWLSKHSVWNFDDPAAHAEAQRIVELWPGGTVGRWTTDPIADDVRYLQSRNGDFAAKPDVVLRAVEAFSDVPAVTLAEARLAAGDVNGAEQLARSADDAGSFDWSSYLFQLTRYRIRTKNLAEASAALQRLPVAARNTHEALLLQSDIASTRAADEPQLRSSCDPAAEFQLTGAREPRTATIAFTSAEPALVDVGLNRARAATVLIEGGGSVSFRLIGYGQQTLWYQRVAGSNTLCARMTTE